MFPLVAVPDHRPGERKTVLMRVTLPGPIALDVPRCRENVLECCISSLLVSSSFCTYVIVTLTTRMQPKAKVEINRPFTARPTIDHPQLIVSRTFLQVS